MINIRVNMFEGPLDLLLHLIKKSEIDIYDIPISEITAQYIEYLNAMEEMNLDVASEFLVMASTLLEIKSKMLLPKRKDETLDEEDPRLELVEKLIEYEKYKNFANRLKEIDENTLIFSKEPEIIDDIEDEETFFQNITLDNIMTIFKKIIDRYEAKHKSEKRVYQNITEDEYKVEDKIDFIIESLKVKRKMNLNDLLIKVKSKIEIIVTFIAVLELIKCGDILVYQVSNFNNITIERQV